MAVSTITISRGSGEYDEWSNSPSNWKDGIYDNGSIKIASQNSSYTGMHISLCTSSKDILATYYFPNGKTTALSTAFSGYTLVGNYLTIQDWDTYYEVLVPIVQHVSSCGAPTSVTLAYESAGPGASVRLSWSGATAGSANAIAGYQVYRANSATGTYTALTKVTTTSTSGSVNVSAPTTNGATYYYKVVTLGSVSGYDSGQSSSYATLTCEASACEPPSTVTVSASSVAPGAKVTLSWSGASAGTNNPIRGYQIYRSTESGDGPYNLLTTVSSTATSGSYTVTAPTTSEASYYYKVVTAGAYSGYHSEQSYDYATVTCNFETATAPTSVTLAATNAAPGAMVELRWDKATAGTNNAIVGYEVYQADSPNGEYVLLTTVTTPDTSGSTNVNAPTTNLESYYFKVKTLASLDGTDSDLSGVYATLTCTYSTPSAPTITVNDATYVYVLPGSTVLLEWSGAIGGANNPVTGYSIYRDDVALVTGLEATVDSYEVTANDTAGNSYSFTVVAEGSFSSSAPSVAVTVYSYTDPTAPTKVTVSDSAPSAGSRVTLSWSGAAAGGYNHITGYRVHRATDANGNYSVVTTVVSTSDADSCFVDAPPVVGYSYYYRVETIGSYSLSGRSSEYAAVTSIEATAPDEDINVYIKPKPPRARRKMVFGEYDTDYDGPWTLCEWTFSEPEAQTNYVEVPGRAAGPLDLSTYLTGGDPRYGSRELTARFECSEGTRLEREELIFHMVNRLHGQRVDIVLPDDDTRYIMGRLHVTKEYNNLAHASISVSAVCDPWRYSKQSTRVEMQAIEVSREFVLSNAGRRILVPTVAVSGYNARVHLTCGDNTWTLTPGEYRLPELALRSGNTLLSCYGSGVITFTYQEAVL